MGQQGQPHGRLRVADGGKWQAVKFQSLSQIKIQDISDLHCWHLAGVGQQREEPDVGCL